MILEAVISIKEPVQRTVLPPRAWWPDCQHKVVLLRLTLYENQLKNDRQKTYCALVYLDAIRIGAATSALSNNVIVPTLALRGRIQNSAAEQRLGVSILSSVQPSSAKRMRSRT